MLETLFQLLDLAQIFGIRLSALGFPALLVELSRIP